MSSVAAPAATMVLTPPPALNATSTSKSKKRKLTDLEPLSPEWWAENIRLEDQRERARERRLAKKLAGLSPIEKMLELNRMKKSPDSKRSNPADWEKRAAYEAAHAASLNCP